MGTLASGSIDLKSLKVAGEGATGYITNITNGGISVHDINDNLNYIKLTSSGMEVFQTSDEGPSSSAISIANFGTSARIGAENNNHATINTTGLHIWQGVETIASNEVANFGSTATIGSINGFNSDFSSTGIIFKEQSTSIGSIEVGQPIESAIESGITMATKNSISRITAGEIIYDNELDNTGEVELYAGWQEQDDTFGDYYYAGNSLVLSTSGLSLYGNSKNYTHTRFLSVHEDALYTSGNIFTNDRDGRYNYIGAVVQGNVNKTITTTGIDTYTEGASITLGAGTWVIIGTWVFQTGSSTGARNMTCALSTSSGSANSGMLARTRIHANSNAWASLQATYLASFTASSTTVYVKGSSTMTYTTAANTDIRAVRIC